MSDHLKKNLTAADVIKDRRKGVKQPIATYCPEPEHGTSEYFLHWWVEQLDDHLAQDKPPNQYDWMHFRPNKGAAEALQKLTTQNPVVVHQLNTTLEFTNRMFDESLNEVDDGSNFWDAKISALPMNPWVKQVESIAFVLRR